MRPFLQLAPREEGELGVELQPFMPPLYFSFLLVGAGLLVVLVITLAIVRPIHRTATLLNLCVVWIVAPLCESFLLFTGEVKGPQPTYRNCLASASFTLASTPLGAFSAFCMVMQIFLLVVHPIKMGACEATVTTVLVALPWVVGLIFLFATLGLGLRRPELVVREKFYCVVDDDQLTEASAAIVVIMMVLAVCLIGTIIWKVWRSPLRTARGRGTLVDFQLGVRLLAFGAYILFAIFAGIVALFDYTSVLPDMVLSTIPLAVFCVFASQHDVLAAWHLIKPHQPTPQGTHHSTAVATGGPPISDSTLRPSRPVSILDGQHGGQSGPQSELPSDDSGKAHMMDSSEGTSSSIPTINSLSKSPLSPSELQMVDVIELYAPLESRDLEEGTRRPSSQRRRSDDRYTPR